MGSIADSLPVGNWVVSPRFDDLGSDGAPRRLGILGGTFDPIHVGHVVAAYAAHRAFDLDAVLFMPSGIPAFKQDTVQASPRERYEMAYLAAHEYHYPYFDASDLETRREGVTYTVDTLRALRAHYPDNVDIAFILGVDALQTLLQWRAADELKELASFIALSRPGYQLGGEAMAALKGHGFDIAELSNVGVEVSSSEVRDRLARGLPVEGYVPRVVDDYITAHGLYGREGGGHERS